ncbi:beta-N-acetylhexosaminidase [Calothrix sp. 336/3]|uniref:beta-N-acetylhexosaminidase n=1 Tax=Calothrix sp. 336/3 TaxID=1337936 RepID=UPI0004E3E033|nr:beta-N-acetylhexosaminidase [Calothrix sp. 336/3]AKG21945.1 glycoside hydrolase [Calothrix sp. 336/3]
MSDIQRFGNHLIIGIAGTKLNDEDKRLLSDLKPVGIVFYGKNFLHDTDYETWLHSFGELIKGIRQYTERERMLLSIDHEGGRVIRPPAPITRFPDAFSQGAKGRQVAQAMAVELKSLGINVSWSPVADIFSNPDNPIIGSRAFSNNAESAAEYAIECYKGLQEAGIIACAKHFPGHGDTSKDSHLELPVLHLTEEELWQRELIPFQKLIQQQIPMVMTAHILFPKIDAEVPATLSQKILTGILREKLGFTGVIVSDDLDMAAVARMYSNSGTVAKTLNAGCDLLMVSRNLPASSPERIYQIGRDFAESLNQGSLQESVVVAAQERIENLLQQTPQYRVVFLDADVLQYHSELAIACSQ